MLQFKRILKAILKYKTSSGLTLLSLVISFLGIIILSLYVSFEKSFDRFNVNAPSVYRLETKLYGSNVPAILRDEIQQNIPEVEKLTLLWFYSARISTPRLKETNISFESSILYSDNSLFDIFTFPLKVGNQATALAEPNTVVLTETYSEKLFGSANPLGENIFIDGEAFKVSGVMKDFPKNSSFRADCIPSFTTFLKDNQYMINHKGDWNFNIFMKLRPGSNPVQVADKIEKIPGIAEAIKDIKGRYPNQALISLLPLTEIHFVAEGNYSYANPVILNVLFLLAVILAVMGAVNLINFSTSQAPLRAKALSVLQLLGGKRLSSMGQIITESVLLAIVALVFSLGIHWLTYSSIESLFGIKGLDFTGRYHFIVWFILFAIGFGVLAGLYPARYITSSPIAQTVKGNTHFAGKGNVFRNTLLTIQFVFTIAMIASAFIIEKQLYFWRNFNIGIDKEHVVYLNTTAELQNHYQAFADELMKNRDITDYTYSQFIPGGVYMGWGREVDGQQIQLKSWPVDDRFLDFFGIGITGGRKFSKGSKADINTFIMNEKAVQQFGWRNPLERRIDGWGFAGQVVGIAKNFNFSSLKEGIEPMLFWLTDTRKSELLLRINPGNYAQTFAYITKTARKFDPKNPVEARFLDDTLNKLYDKEEKMGHFIEFVAIWCILLAVTGLLGLIIFICRDRIKEIGIRKVNGAKIIEVMSMLNRDIIRWVVVAIVVATPVAWYAMNKWIESFAYKTAISWWIFALAGAMALGIALLTVSWQSWKAATRNPVEALRYE